MFASFPILLIPGLLCSARLYGPQIPPVTIADHTRDANIADIARRILADAPAALSSGGPFHGRLHRLRGLASGGGSRGQACAPRHLGARADVPEQTKGRYALIELARTKGLRAVNNFLFPLIVHESRNDDRGLRPIVDSMAEDAGVEAFVRQQTATWVAPIRVPICRRSAVPPSLSSAIPTRSLRPTSPGK